MGNLINHSEGSTTFLGSDSEIESLRDFADQRGFPGELITSSALAADDTAAEQTKLLFRDLTPEDAESLIAEFQQAG